MTSEYVDDEHHLLRLVPWARLRKDENDKVIGILAQAFKLRAGEEYLSAGWVEYYAGSADPIADATSSFRKILKIKPKDRFTNGRVGEIKEACARSGIKVRVTREPIDQLQCHCGVRQFRDENDALLDLLAAEVWAELHPPV